MTLVEFIEDVELCNFRTPNYTGANTNAMMVWNILRNYAGLESLTQDDLIERYWVAEKGMTLEEGRAAQKEFDDWYRKYQDEQTMRRLNNVYKG